MLFAFGSIGALGGQMKGILLGALAVLLGTAVYVMVGIALASVG